MELHDALIPFKHKGAPGIHGGTKVTALLNVDVLTDDHELLTEIEEALILLRAAIKPVERIDDAKDRIERGDVDLTIVHVDRADAWPGVAFKLFDDGATTHPIVILCGHAEDARHYRKWSDHIIDILPTEAVRDYRFRFAIEGALLRAELLLSAKPGHDDPSVA
jgi:hypothetical protein